MPEALFVRLGTVCVVGHPADVVNALGRALRECYATWGAGDQLLACDGPDVNAHSGQAATALPPLVVRSEIGVPPSRSASAPAKLLVLDGGAAISDHHTTSGGGIGESFYLTRDEGDGA